MATAKKRTTVTPTHTSDLLQYVYTDKSGNNYFEFINDAAMPYKRFVDAQVTEKMIRLGFSQSGIEQLIKACETIAVDATKTAEQLRADIFTLGANLKGRLGYLAGHRMYEQFAAIFYVMEDEPITPSDRWYMKKFDIWSQDEAARSFFLHGAFKKIHALTEISVKDMMHSFQMAEIREESLPTLNPK